MRRPIDFALNAWYAAGWSKDIGTALSAITICDQPIILYRKSDSTVCALEDACMHRLVPLSLGRLDGDNVVCGYHGMTFDGHGKCVRMPGAGGVKPSAAARVRAFPVIERHNMVWVWPGDVGLADPARVPDLHWADDPDWAAGSSWLDMACDYRLVLDNLMDLTHETFVHASSIGDPEIIEAPFEVSATDGFVELRRWMLNITAPPFLAAQLKRAHGLPANGVDRWQIIRFEPPSVIVIDVGVAPTGTDAQQGDRSLGVNGRVLNAVTPGTMGRCRYFFAYARNFAIDDAVLTNDLRERNIGIFLEDKAVLEAQQTAMERLPERRLLNFGIDKGSMQARRAIEALIDAERRHDEAA